jgi:hypothetical protein
MTPDELIDCVAAMTDEQRHALAAHLGRSFTLPGPASLLAECRRVADDCCAMPREAALELLERLAQVEPDHVALIRFFIRRRTPNVKVELGEVADDTAVDVLCKGLMASTPDQRAEMLGELFRLDRALYDVVALRTTNQLLAEAYAARHDPGITCNADAGLGPAPAGPGDHMHYPVEMAGPAAIADGASWRLIGLTDAVVAYKDAVLAAGRTRELLDETSRKIADAAWRVSTEERGRWLEYLKVSDPFLHSAVLSRLSTEFVSPFMGADVSGEIEAWRNDWDEKWPEIFSVSLAATDPKPCKIIRREPDLDPVDSGGDMTPERGSAVVFSGPRDADSGITCNAPAGDFRPGQAVLLTESTFLKIEDAEGKIASPEGTVDRVEESNIGPICLVSFLQKDGSLIAYWIDSRALSPR